MTTSILFLLWAYLLGSVPFGYVVSRFSTRKNVLEVGWKKTSGSNVFVNIGKWQGVVTGILDITKGFLAVWLTQKFNLPIEIQGLAGVAAVVGHNWSVFLKFAGGRGIGTFFGAALALVPQIAALFLISFLVLALVWHTSIATILGLMLFILFSFYFHKVPVALFFGVTVLFPIFIKRLSPLADLGKPGPFEIKERNKIITKTDAIRNRLVYDDNLPYYEFRIKRIIKRITSTP